MPSDVLTIKESDLKDDCYRLNRALGNISDSVAQIRDGLPQTPLVYYSSKSTSITYTVATPNYADAGPSVVLTRTGMWIISCVWEFVCIGAGDVGQTFQGNLNLNGYIQGTSAVYVPRNVGDIGNVRQQYFVRCTSEGQIAKLQSVKSGGGGTSVTDFNTTMIAQWINP